MWEKFGVTLRYDPWCEIIARVALRIGVLLGSPMAEGFLYVQEATVKFVVYRESPAVFIRFIARVYTGGI